MGVWREWFVAEGWVSVLACLNLLLVVRVFFWTRSLSIRVARVLALQDGLKERLQAAIDRSFEARDEARRATEQLASGELEAVGNSDATKIREPA